MPDFKIYNTYTDQTTGQTVVEGKGWWSTETGFGYGEMPKKKSLWRKILLWLKDH